MGLYRASTASHLSRSVTLYVANVYATGLESRRRVRTDLLYRNLGTEIRVYLYYRVYVGQ